MKIKLANVKLNINSNYGGYNSYLKTCFSPLEYLGEDLNVEIDVIWVKKYFKRKIALNKDRLKEYQRIGASTFVSPSSLMRIEKINKKKTAIRISLKEDLLRMYFEYPLEVFKSLSKKHLANLFAELTYYFVYFPVFWYIEKFYHQHLLHASAVNVRNKHIVIMGMESVGKTTLAFLLQKHFRGKVLTDNLAFYDGSEIHPCYEILKFRQDSLSELSMENLIKLGRTQYREIYRLNTETREGFSPDVFILPCFGKAGFIKKIGGEEAANRVINSNSLSCEIEKYHHFCDIINLIPGQGCFYPLRYERIKKLLSVTKCYILGISSRERYFNAAERILSVIR